jgi:sugar phosphate permease
MINLGAIGAGKLASLLSTGFAIPLLLFTITIPRMDWRYVFILPPVVVLIVIVFMNLGVKNAPEEAGYHVAHDDEDAEVTNEKFTLLDVFRKIASNPTVWIVAAAYFCTGFVRRAVESWWAVYLKEVWNADASSGLYAAFVWGLPITATVGSMASGYVSDFLFRGRRAPVAAVLYALQVVITIVAMRATHGGAATGALAVTLIIGISTMCNSTHSILGTAAAMDLGGRKMAGCSSGIIDSFQYYGAILSGWGLGAFFEYVAKLEHVADAAAFGTSKMSPTVWLGSMIPFGLLGTSLMTYLWLKHRGAEVKGT